ncbi:MAG: phosphoribosylformylglycinamidine cyclo-ligase [archaeon]
MSNITYTYKESGVDINAADANQRIIKQAIKSTYSEHVIPDDKGLGAMFAIPTKYNNPVMVSGTDSVGTKLMIAFMMNKHDTVGIDIVALCANDVLRRGAAPLYFLDFIGIHELKQEKINDIIEGIIAGCKQANCSLIGGETAQLPEFHKEDEYELVGFCSGVVERSQIITGDNIRPGNKIIGLASSGLHSNGYTLARKVLLSKFKINDIAYEKTTIGDALLFPSRIYVKPVLDILEKNRESIVGLCNITGSAFNKLKKLNPDVGFRIDKLLPIPKIFSLIQREGNISDYEMFSTFNMGIGYCIIARDASFITDFEKIYGYKADVIGVVDDSKKVTICENNIVL